MDEIVRFATLKDIPSEYDGTPIAAFTKVGADGKIKTTVDIE